MIDTELARLRAALGARAEDCWERLEDAVSELCTVHDVGQSEIVERIRSIVSVELDTASSNSA